MPGKTILITGAGRGIGARAAEVLAEKGWNLIICARTKLEIEETAYRIAQNFGASVYPIVCDVADPVAVKDMMDQALALAGGVNVLVNNAGVPGPVGPLDKTGLAEWRHTMDVNLMGMVQCTRAVLPTMRKQEHGKIINIVGGGIGWRTLPAERTAYVASKYAAYGFVESLAVELKNTGIQVNAVSPGPVQTRAWDHTASKESRRHVRERGHDLSPDPAARMIAFLASDRSGTLTGKILSARWDNPDDLVRDMDALNESCSKTLRKIDDTNYICRD